MKIVGVIPARYQSSRFPGKPLADICGKPMIWWVYNQCMQVDDFDSVYVATDDERIKKVCEDLNINVLMTSDKHKSAVDRTTEVAEKVDGDLFVIVMGDEPLISPDNIQSLISAMKTSEYDGGMLCTKFKNGVDLINTTTINLAINEKNELIYMSRFPIPYPKAYLEYCHYKNVGVYSFTRKSLEFYKNTPRGILERIEDMEMLRMIENHKLVNVVEVQTDSMSVDTYKDLARIRIKAAELICDNNQFTENDKGGGYNNTYLVILYNMLSASIKGGRAA